MTIQQHLGTVKDYFLQGHFYHHSLGLRKKSSLFLATTVPNHISPPKELQPSRNEMQVLHDFITFSARKNADNIYPKNHKKC